MGGASLVVFKGAGFEVSASAALAGRNPAKAIAKWLDGRIG